MLEVKELSFSYPTSAVLESISFSVNEHDILAILGRNAAGKTTLTNVLTGVLMPQSGSVYIDGVDINRANSPYFFGVMRPLSDIYRKMTIFEYLSLVATFYNIPGREIEQRVRACAERFSFAEHLYKMLSKCSLGTQKKAMFVAAMIHNPKFIILDEPFESLDPVICYEMKQFLKEYAETDGTVLITSHALDIVEHFCSHYMILNERRVAAQGRLDKMEKSLEQVFLETVGGMDED